MLRFSVKCVLPATMALVARYDLAPDMGAGSLVLFDDDVDSTLHQVRLVGGIVDATDRRFIRGSPYIEWEASQCDIGGNGGSIIGFRYSGAGRTLLVDLPDDDGLKIEELGLRQHDQVIGWLTIAADYDQLDLTNCDWADMARCQAPVMEGVYMDGVHDAGGGTNFGKEGDHLLSLEELPVFTGWYLAGGLVMCCPLLMEHVKFIAEKDAAVFENIRRARQERSARRSGKDPLDEG